MHLKLKPDNKTHISHFMKLVSAWEPTEERVNDLIRMIEEAKIEAAEKTDGVIVEQDSLEHIFIVWPNGTVSLYREVGNYEVIQEKRG